MTPLILMVDDREENLGVLENTLSGMGYDLVRARSGQEALRKLLHDDYAVVLLDIHMPDMDGYETAELIRQRERTRHLPILFMTAFGPNEVDSARGYALGAIDFIFKPFTPVVVRAKIAALAAVHQHAQEREAHILGLTREKERLRLFSLTSELFCIADSQGTVTQASPGFMEILTLSILSRPFIEAVHPADRSSVTDLLADAPGHAAFECRSPNERWIAWNVTYFSDDRLFYFVGRDITERKRTETALKLSEEQYRDLFENATDLLYIALPDGRLQYVNKAWRETLGYPLDYDMSQLSIFDILHPDHFHEFIRTEARKFETVFLSRDGREIAVEGSVTGRFIDGQLVCVRGMFHDITERKRLDRMKSDFICTVSHEIRNPLTAIHGALGLLAGGKAGPLTRTGRQMVEIAYRDSDRLARLVTDILDVEKIQSGKMTFRLEAFNLVAAVKEAMEAARGHASQYRVSVNLEKSVSRVLIYADRDRILQVLSNLISNAVKFSPQGKSVSVTVARKDGRVRVGISDRGPGVPQEFRTRLFEKFEQADGSKKGSGLGLSIANAILKRLGGELSFQSTPNVRTTFGFELPEYIPKTSHLRRQA